MTKYVDVVVVKDGNYYSIDLVGENGTRYPIAMVKTLGEALHLRDVEFSNLNV